MEDKVHKICLYTGKINIVNKYKLIKELSKDKVFKYEHVWFRISNKQYKKLRNKQYKNLVILQKFKGGRHILSIRSRENDNELISNIERLVHIVEKHNIEIELIGYLTDKITINTKINQIYLGG